MMANAPGKSSLFIGDLAIFCSERDIEEAFAPYGEIQEIKIMRSEETSRNLSYGFIKFSTPQSAKIAMSQLNGVILCGRPLRIRWATYKNKMGVKEQRQDVLETSPVHVSFISYQIDKLVTEESLRVLFSQYGVVVDASIKKSMIDQDVRRQSGYGFVHYAITNQGIHAAIRAATSLDDITVESVNYKCSLSHNLNKYLTGELTLPVENPTGPGGNMGIPMGAGPLPPGAGGGMHSGFDELDSEQYFRPPSQPYASVPVPRAPAPPSASVYRPNQTPQQPQYGPPSSHYQNGVGGLQQQYGMSPQQQPHHYNNLQQQPRGPQLYRSSSYGHSSIPSSQNGNARPRSLPVGTYSQGLNPDTPPYDRAYDAHMGHQHSQYPDAQYGQNSYEAPFVGQHNQAPYSQQHFHMDDAENVTGPNNITGFVPGRSLSANGRTVGGPGTTAGNAGYAPRHSQQFSSGSATLAALGNRGGPVGSRSTGVAPVGPVSRLSNATSAPTMNQHQGFGAPDRWSTGSYNVAPSGPSGSINGHAEAGLSDNYLQPPGPPGPPAPHRGPMPPSQGFHLRGDSSHTDFSMGQSGSDPMLALSGGLSGLQVQPPSQAYPLQSQQQQAPAPPQHFSSHFGLQGGSQPTQGPPPQQQQQQFFNNFQHAPSPFSAPNATITVNTTGPNGVPFTLHISPPPSPLPSYSASPVMSSGLGGFGQFLNGYSPVFRTAPTATTAASLNPFLHPSMSPMSPRDVNFEESISNVHNLITPATYFRSSPLVVGHDLAYSPAMFQGNFSANANAFGTNTSHGYNAYQGFDLNMYNAGGGNNNHSNVARSQVGRNTGVHSNNNNKHSPLAGSNNTSSTESATTAAVSGTDSPAAYVDKVLPVPPLASAETGESFFGAALDGGGESLEALEPEGESGALEDSETDLKEPDVDTATADAANAPAGSDQQPLRQQIKEEGTNTATAAVTATASSTPVAKPAPAPSRRNKIIMHTKQLIA